MLRGGLHCHGARVVSGVRSPVLRLNTAFYRFSFECNLLGEYLRRDIPASTYSFLVSSLWLSNQVGHDEAGDVSKNQHILVYHKSVT